MVHAILAGTDSTEWWMIAIYATSGVTVFTLILFRIFGKKYFINSARAKYASKPIVVETPTNTEGANLQTANS